MLEGCRDQIPGPRSVLDDLECESYSRASYSYSLIFAVASASHCYGTGMARVACRPGLLEAFSAGTTREVSASAVLVGHWAPASAHQSHSRRQGSMRSLAPQPLREPARRAKNCVLRRHLSPCGREAHQLSMLEGPRRDGTGCSAHRLLRPAAPASAPCGVSEAVRMRARSACRPRSTAGQAYERRAAESLYACVLKCLRRLHCIW